MAEVISKYAETVMLRSVNRLINKYGHAVTLKQKREGEPDSSTQSKATFGRFKVAFGSGGLIINNNYKVRLRADEFTYDIQPQDKVVVNGVELVVVTGRKISPDGATTIVWELECSGGTIPEDGNSAGTPRVISPTDNTSFYPSVAVVGGLYSASFTASAYEVLSGDTEYVSSDWQISPDSAFAFIQNEVYGYTGDGLSSTGGTTWVSDVVLNNPANYYVRVRHNGSGGVQTRWSNAHLFSLGELTTTPAEDIVTPTMVNVLSDGVLSESDYYREYDTNTSGYVYKVFGKLSEFSSGTGKVFDHCHWQLSRNSSFTNLVWEGDSAGGYDVEISLVMDYNQSVMPFFEYDHQMLYMRGKYVSTDGKESEYSDVLSFFMDYVSTPVPVPVLLLPTVTNGNRDSVSWNASGDVPAGTLSVSGVYNNNNTYSCWKMLDGNSTTYWYPTSQKGVGSWWKVDFETPCEYSKFEASFSGGTFRPTKLKVEVSNDDLSWSTLTILDVPTNESAPNATITFDLPPAGFYKYIRTTCTEMVNPNVAGYAVIEYKLYGVKS